MPRRFRVCNQPTTEERVSRAARLRRRGETRKSLLVLREACCAEESNPRLWALYGYRALLAGKVAEAGDALRRAVWIFERCRDERRAQAVRRLVDRLEPHWATG